MGLNLKEIVYDGVSKTTIYHLLKEGEPKGVVIAKEPEHGSVWERGSFEFIPLYGGNLLKTISAHELSNNPMDSNVKRYYKLLRLANEAFTKSTH